MMICPPWQTPWQWQASAYANGDYWMRKLQNFRCLYSLGHCNRWPRISPTSSDLPRKGSGSAEKCTPFGFPSESSCFVTEAGRPECRPMRTRKPRQAPSLLASDLRHAIARQLTVAARPLRVWTLSLSEVQAAASGCESVAFGQSHRKSSCCVSRQNATASAVSWKAIWKASPSVVTCTRSFSVHGNGSTCNTCKVEPHNRCAWQELA